MPRPRRQDRDVAILDTILAAAEAQFAAAGLDKARLEDIAAAAGIRRPSLLYHYASKEALYAATVRHAFDRLGGVLLAALDAAGDVAGRIDAGLQAFRRFLDADPGFARLVLREVVDGRGPGREILVTEMQPLLERLDAALGAHQRARLLDLAAAALVRSAAGPLAARLWGAAPPPPFAPGS